jgi:hypothetical protein
LTTLSCGASTGVLVLPVQRGSPGQVGSPPPLTVALLTRMLPLAAAVGVTERRS